MLVAALTGLAAYWRWTDEWRGFVLALLTLKSLHASWEIALIEASLQPEAEGRATAIKATMRLVREAGRAVRRETAERFETLSFADDGAGAG